ncbi:hypothetical protein SAMN05421752_14016 [Natronorubrum thiooxidans]|uniref:Uncharacterized protein n=1 Tax=Natronorubrum thiooxidans TaxID=308853 RepID=A0A1N7HA60_9EURY|nr:hypothetical protein SAMN05421752_14016 [Natronorubrum thiooxidans]
MTEFDDTSVVYPTDPDTSLSYWKSTPSRREQILEAAADDPDLQSLTNHWSLAKPQRSVGWW